MVLDINLEGANMKYTLKTKLSLTVALVVLLTVALISLLANFFIEKQFKGYITNQQKKQTQEIVTNIGKLYDKKANTWNVDFVHAIGMYALYDGYIIKVYDQKKQIVWDAEASNMSMCLEVMNDISHRMMMEYPKVKGEFTSKTFSAMQGNEKVGTVKISYFGPYFLSNDDYQFLNALNKILIIIGFLSITLSVIVGFFMAKRISRPILKMVAATKQISSGDYKVRIAETTETKELDDLIISINYLAGSLEKQEMLRRQLTTDVAHELRTPLTTVQTHIEALIEGVWEPTTERLQSCYDELTRICKLVSNLERLSKMESHNLKMNKTQVGLLDLANKIIKNFETELKNKNLSVSIMGNSSEVSVDQDQISQVMFNLISNAVKYTQNSGEIKITISETDDSVIFSVEDNGIGIAEDEIPFIFERFYRADKSRNRNTGGSGIGLAIVKAIVTDHGGSIEVESRLNKGSCFMISLPKSN